MKINLVIGAVVLMGAIDPDCTVEKVCTPGYTDTVRPSASYTNKLKRQQMAERDIKSDPSQYEEDHFISLELCGNPTNPANLWPEPWPEARKKDVEETALHRKLCKGQISLEDAQAQLRKDWRIHK